MKWTRHRPEQIIVKLRDADGMLAAGRRTGEVWQTLGISEGRKPAKFRYEFFSTKPHHSRVFAGKKTNSSNRIQTHKRLINSSLLCH